jgi:hypothetical protein
VPTALITLNGDSEFLRTYSGPASSPLMETYANLPAGLNSFVASYPGDSTYHAIISAPLTISVAALTTTTTLSGPYFTPSGSSISLSATASGVLDVPSGEYTPNVQFYNGKSLIGSVAPAIALSSTSTTTATATLSTTLPAGSYTITAVWPGDRYTSSSTSAVLPVVSSAAGITVTPATRQVTLPAPGATGFDTLTITSFGGFTGGANLTCAVSYSGSFTISAAPTCSLSQPTVTLTAGGTATSILTLSTVGAQTVADFRNVTPGQGPLVLCVVGFISTLVRRRRFAASEHWRACLLARARRSMLADARLQ